MRRRNVLLGIAAAVAATAIPMPGMANVPPGFATLAVSDQLNFFSAKFQQIAAEMVGGAGDTWHYHVRWKRYVKLAEQLGIRVNYAVYDIDDAITGVRYTLVGNLEGYALSVDDKFGQVPV